MGPLQHPFSVVTFRDALGLAMELADEYAFVNAAALIEASGEVLDLVIAEGIGKSIEPVVSWSADAVRDRHPPSRSPAVNALLLSVRPFDDDVIREQDLHHYRNARWRFSVAGSNLVDWIETDGDLFRSYAYVTCPAQAWSQDPPGDRLSDGRLR